MCVFKDDNINWVSNLLKAGAKDVKLQIYRLLPHGFLHVGQPSASLAGMSFGHECTEKAVELFNELIEAPDLAN